MTMEEINRAAMKELPVICKGINYQYICGICKRRVSPHGKIIWIYQVEMIDKTGRSVTVDEPKKIELVDPSALGEPEPERPEQEQPKAKPKPKPKPKPKDDETDLSPVVIEIILNDKTFHKVTAEDVKEYEEDFPAVDVMQELRKMKQWSKANVIRRKTKKGINAFIVNWLSDEQDHPKRKNTSKNEGNEPEIDLEEFIEKPSLLQK